LQTASPPSPVASQTTDVDCWDVWHWTVHEVTQQSNTGTQSYMVYGQASLCLYFQRRSQHSPPPFESVTQLPADTILINAHQ